MLGRIFRWFLGSAVFPAMVITATALVVLSGHFGTTPSRCGQPGARLPAALLQEAVSPVRPATSASSPPVQPEPDESAYTEITGLLKPGDTLTRAFRRQQVPEQVRLQVIRALSAVLDFRELRPFDRYVLRLDDSGQLVQCRYESGPLTVHRVVREADGSLKAEKVAIHLERRTMRIDGTVHSSLYAAFLPHHEDPRLIYRFADIFASHIDFNTETRSGDRFSMVFEKYYKHGAFIGYGRILVARYQQRDGRVLEGFYFDDNGDGRGSYFDREGRELGASFIRSPVPMARVSSRFTHRRLHPILKVVRPHLGVDLAAPTGTPVMAAADGRVRFIGRNGGFGKQIVLDHGGGYRTYYGHLSRYRKGLRVGSRVKQKQIIGYVGATGLATGPHLDYRVRHNGVFQNPFALKFKPRSVLAGERLARFRERQAALQNLMDLLDDPKVLQVKNLTVTPDQKISLL